MFKYSIYHICWLYMLALCWLCTGRPTVHWRNCVTDLWSIHNEISIYHSFSQIFCHFCKPCNKIQGHIIVLFKFWHFEKHLTFKKVLLTWFLTLVSTYKVLWDKNSNVMSCQSFDSLKSNTDHTFTEWTHHQHSIERRSVFFSMHCWHLQSQSLTTSVKVKEFWQGLKYHYLHLISLENDKTHVFQHSASILVKNQPCGHDRGVKRHNSTPENFFSRPSPDFSHILRLSAQEW